MAKIGVTSMIIKPIPSVHGIDGDGNLIEEKEMHYEIISFTTNEMCIRTHGSVNGDVSDFASIVKTVERHFCMLDVMNDQEENPEKWGMDVKK